MVCAEPRDEIQELALIEMTEVRQGQDTPARIPRQ